ncbi:ABC transporter substrate-binding protein [Marinobacter adhaerens]|uniref:ABC transporter substrate-binding protein n=1 Tax=Marinobacter adhaerens TaxID=1033846 RepID=UPI003BABA795
MTEVSDDQLATLENSPVITVGPAAFSKARQANRSAAILAMLVDRSFISAFAERSPGQISAVLYDVPLIRQALTGKAILPQATKIALLATADSVELYEPLIDELPAYGMSARIFLVESNDNLISTLVRALGYGDFLLAAPDSAIYNPRTIKHILLTAYRRNQIVIGPTQAYVKAGSLASSYAPFPEMVEMAGSFLSTFFETGAYPEPSYPKEFRVEVNAQVARSLNIPLPSREDIATRVDRQLAINGEASDE